MPPRLSLSLACACIGACGSSSVADATDGDVPFWDAELGLAFDLPPHWIESIEAGAAVFSGARGSDAYHTTITLQRVGFAEGSAPLSLDETLEAAYAPVAGKARFHWDWIEPSSVGGVPGLRYTVQFEHHESLRRKSGLLLLTGAGAIDLAYGASDEVFWAGLPALETVLSSLWIDVNRRAGRETASPGVIRSAP